MKNFSRMNVSTKSYYQENLMEHNISQSNIVDLKENYANSYVGGFLESCQKVIFSFKVKFMFQFSLTILVPKMILVDGAVWEKLSRQMEN